MADAAVMGFEWRFRCGTGEFLAAMLDEGCGSSTGKRMDSFEMAVAIGTRFRGTRFDTALVSALTRGTTRNDIDGCLGGQITIGGSSFTVTRYTNLLFTAKQCSRRLQ